MPFDRVHFDSDMLKETVEYLIVRENELMEAVRQIKVLSLLALLVQKY